MNFVDEENRSRRGDRQPFAGLNQRFAQLLNAVRNRAQLPENAAALLRQEVSERRLPDAGRAVKNRGAEPVGLQEAAQQFPFAEKTFLPDELRQPTRPHARGQRERTHTVFALRRFKQRRQTFLPLPSTAGNRLKISFFLL